MIITDELREYVGNFYLFRYKDVREKLDAIADRIDEKHYDTQADAYDNGANYVFNNPTLFGLMPLPKDADGRVINIGDELDGYGYPYGGSYCKAIVNETMILVGEKDSSYTTWLMWDARSVRHHHETTVEDVLREFALEIDPSADIAVTGAETIKKFAAKLQLKESSE